MHSLITLLSYTSTFITHCCYNTLFHVIIVLFHHDSTLFYTSVIIVHCLISLFYVTLSLHHIASDHNAVTLHCFIPSLFHLNNVLYQRTLHHMIFISTLTYTTLTNPTLFLIQYCFIPHCLILHCFASHCFIPIPKD